jgi:hypothetical protein
MPYLSLSLDTINNAIKQTRHSQEEASLTAATDNVNTSQQAIRHDPKSFNDYRRVKLSSNAFSNLRKLFEQQ